MFYLVHYLSVLSKTITKLYTEFNIKDLKQNVSDMRWQMYKLKLYHFPYQMIILYTTNIGAGKLILSCT